MSYIIRRLLKPASWLFLACVLQAGVAEAREWAIVGPRALGMGGANVAVANDSTASYWNPAAYGFFKDKGGGDYGQRTFSAALDAGAGVAVHEDLGEAINRIAQYDFDALSSGNMTAQYVADFIQIINELKEFAESENMALTVAMNGSLGVQAGRFGFGGYVFGDMSARGDLDLYNISPVDTGGAFTIDDFTDPANYGCTSCTGGTYLTSDQTSSLDSYLTGLGWTSTQSDNFINAMDYGLTQAEAQGETIPADIVQQIEAIAGLADVAADAGGSISDNESALVFKGIALAEFPVTYGHPVTEDLAVGASVKYMTARVYNTAIPLFNTDFNAALNDALDDYKDSSNIGLDVAALYRFGDKLRVGVVGRNLNSPSFDMDPLYSGDDDSIEEGFQARAGLAYKPLDFVTLAMDLDLTENDTTVSGDYKSRDIAAGVEASVFKIVQLRAGVYTNLSESDVGPVFTAGLGLNLWVVNLDIGAAMSSDTTTIDSTDIPHGLKAELALSALY
jgi:hypothetical protein